MSSEFVHLALIPALTLAILPMLGAARAVLVASTLLAGPVWAAIDAYQFDNPVDEKRFRDLTFELRCPKCQNQNIADCSPEELDTR